MLRELLSSVSSNGALLVAALLLFFVTFLGIVVWTFRRSGRDYYAAMASKPLDDRPFDERTAHE